MAKKPKKKVAKKRSREPVAPELDADGNVKNPGEVHDTEDPGDETQRRYRYQHAYGAILLTGIATGRLDYQSIWCEHHDDYLAQADEMFDSFQVKTRQPENGYWELTTDGFISAIKKFTTLETRFPGKLGRFKFVSNACVSNSSAQTKIKRAPQQLLTAIDAVDDVSKLNAPFNDSLAKLAQACGVDTTCLFNVFKRLELIVGPSLADFEVAISQTHIASLGSCNSFAPHQLNAIRDELIQKVFDASSNFVDDPAKHWCCVNGTAISDPRVQAKQLFPSVVATAVQAKSPPYFRYSDITTRTGQRVTTNNLSTLEKKLLQGNLRQQIETMKRRTTSTERHLLELAAAKPQEIQQIRNQLEAVVQGVCDDASLNSRFNGLVSGTEMMKLVLAELKDKAKEQPGNVYGESYECMVGMSGLLTEDCTVWWSERFDLDEASA